MILRGGISKNKTRLQAGAVFFEAKDVPFVV